MRWLYDLEYKIFKVPKPDITLILKLSPDLSEKLSVQNVDRKIKKQAYLLELERDIHENHDHLKRALDCYLDIAEQFPDDFEVIECLEGNKLLPPEAIHEKIWELSRKTKVGFRQFFFKLSTKACTNEIFALNYVLFTFI